MIVDASVAFRWFVDERGSEDALALLRAEEPLFAPEILLPEVAGALRAAVAAGALDAADAREAIARLPSVLTQLTPAVTTTALAFDLSLELGRSVMACSYLALADLLNDSLVTADRQLLKALSGHRLESRLRVI